MDWEDVQTDLPDLVGGLLGGIPCQWEDQPLKMQQTAQAKIDLLRPRSIGTDERLVVDTTIPNPPDPDEPAIEETVVGQRLIDLRVTVWSRSQKIQDSARAHLEKLRARLYWSSTIAALSALGFALVNVGDTQEGDPVEDQRVVSLSTVEVTLAYVHTETDEAGPFIETARVYSDKARNAAGDELPASVQMDATGPEI